MLTTTPDLIADDFVDTIKASLPPTVAGQAYRWRESESIEDLATIPELRRFYIDTSPGTPKQSGIYGDGIEREFTLRVWTSYGAMRRRQANSLIEQDAAHLHVIFTRRQSNQLPGLIHVEPSEWEDGDEGDTPGHRYGAHTFTITYLAPGQF